MENKSIEDSSTRDDITAKLQIFTISNNSNGASCQPSATVDDSYETENKPKQKRRKKKRTYLNLKKTSSKVQDGSLPPIKSHVSGNGPLVLEQTIPSSSALADDKSTISGTKEAEADEKTLSQSPKEPLLIFKLVTRYPLLSFGLMSLVHVATLAVTGALLGTGHDVFPLVFDELPLVLYNDVRLYELSWKRKSEFEDFIYRPVYGVTYPTWRRGFVKDTLEVIFEEPYGGNVLSTTNLKRIQQAEDDLFHNPQYQSYYCVIDYYDNCIKPSSILRLFDGTYEDVDPIFKDPEFSNISAVVYAASQTNDTKGFLDLFLGKDARVTPEVCFTTLTRTFIPMGWPLSWRRDLLRYGSINDLEQFLQDTAKPAVEYIRDSVLVDQLNVYYVSKILYETDLVTQALADIQLAIGSFLFIFLFMCFQMGSLTLASLGIFSVLCSFLLTNLLYRYVFRYIYFGFFHVIAIFLILGIGADDLFVFYDTWRLTGHTEYPSDAHRLSDCFMRAAKTTLVTSFTTMTAFLVSGLSPLLPVSTFGIFAGVLVLINYLQVITYFPTVIILHHSKIKGNWQKCHAFLLRIWTHSSSSSTENKVDVQDEAQTPSPSCSTVALIVPDKIKHNKDKPASNNNSTFTLQSTPRHASIHDSDFSTHFEKTKHHRKKNKRRRHRSVDGHNTLDNKDSLGQSTEQFVCNPDELVRKNMAASNKIRKPSRRGSSQFQCLEPAINESPRKTCSCDGQDVENAKPCSCEDKKLKKSFEDRNKVVVFLKNSFFDFVTKRTVKIMIPLFFLAASIFFIHRATLIEPDSTQLRMFRDDHNYAKASYKHYYSFRKNNDDDYTRVYLVWGMDKADISDCNLKSTEFCHGHPVWNDQFQINSLEEQQAVKDMCNRLENISPAYADKLRIRRDAITQKLQISCFTTDMERFFEEKFKDDPDLQLTIPVDKANITEFMDKKYWVYRSGLVDDFDRYFEILISYWLSNGYTYQETLDYYKYTNLLAEQYVEGQSKDAYYTYSNMYYGTRLRYLAVEVNTTMDVYSLGYTEGLPVYQEWQDLVASINSAMPPSLQGGFHVTKDLWHWLHVQETLSTSAKTGILVGLLTAWPILILTTLNFVIGTLAAIVISLVTCCVIGIIPLAGWKLGVLESINLCMVVGLSVDYVVHLAEAYRMSQSARRMDRVQDMLESIGLSVLSGAFTTMGAAIFMLFAKIQFFYQFGIFILSTVGIALLFSLFGFTTFMSLCGPEGNTGSLRHLFKKFVNCCSGKKKTKKQCSCTPSSLMDRFFDWLSYKSDVLATPEKSLKK